MPRARKTNAPPSRVGKRDYKAEYAWRIKGVPVGDRSQARGHRGQTAQFLRELEEGDLIFCDITAVRTKKIKRNGRSVTVFPLIVKDVSRARTVRKGASPVTGRQVRKPTKTYRLRNLTERELRSVIRREERIGVVFPIVNSLDQRRLVKS